CWTGDQRICQRGTQHEVVILPFPAADRRVHCRRVQDSQEMRGILLVETSVADERCRLNVPVAERRHRAGSQIPEVRDLGLLHCSGIREVPDLVQTASEWRARHHGERWWRSRAELTLWRMS